MVFWPDRRRRWSAIVGRAPALGDGWLRPTVSRAERRALAGSGWPSFQPGRAARASRGASAGSTSPGRSTCEELTGKIVLLDFWTYCCINCHHVLPDLAKLEKKYKNELVVIGVHTAKFDAERDTENIRQKVAEYRIKHPVVNDANQVIWNRFGVKSWPTLVLIDADGRLRRLGQRRGALRRSSTGRSASSWPSARRKGELNDDAAQVLPREREARRHAPALPGQGPGRRRGQAAVHRRHRPQPDRHDRPRGQEAGRRSARRRRDWSTATYDKAEFNRPQGMCLVGETLYVADTENHAIRAVDLKAKTVTTVAGNGPAGAAPLASGSGRARRPA